MRKDQNEAAQPVEAAGAVPREKQLEAVAHAAAMDLVRIHEALGLPADDEVDAERILAHIAATHPAEPVGGAAPVSGGEREQFEAWAGANSFYLKEMPEKNKRGPASVYYNARTQQAWEGWQARAAVAAKAAPVGSAQVASAEQGDAK
jgi:hypothetical protein